MRRPEDAVTCPAEAGDEEPDERQGEGRGKDEEPELEPDQPDQEPAEGEASSEEPQHHRDSYTRVATPAKGVVSDSAK